MFSVDIKLVCPKKQDYCGMYELLENLDYNIHEDIHLQFCEKHGLTPKKRPARAQNQYGLDDCKNS